MRVLFFCLALAATGCGGPRFVNYTPHQQKTGLDPKKLYDAAEGTLLDRGYLIAERDEAHFRLVTEPRTLLGSEIGKSKFRYAWTVESASGTLKITLACKEAGGLGDPADCNQQAPEKIVAEQDAIASQAVREAKGP
ncbi:MAG: hypothetical protein HYZ29_27305 [Myxococcales bacterium]|nr:hypothetical protein [Myxococcales bacterium]